MKKYPIVRILSIVLALAVVICMFTSCKEKESVPTFDEAQLPTIAPAECSMEFPVQFFKDIDDIDLSAYTMMAKTPQRIDNGDGTSTELTVTSYFSPETYITIDITTTADGTFSSGTVTYADESNIAVAIANYSAPFKEIADARFNISYEAHDTWRRETSTTAYFVDEIFKYAVHDYTIYRIEDEFSTPAYSAKAVYTTQGILAASYVSVTGEPDFRYYNTEYLPVSQTIYSILVASIQYSQYLIPDEETASYAAEKLSVTLPEDLTNDFSKFKKTDDYVLTDTKANYYGDNLKDDNGNPFTTTTTIYKNDKNGYTVDMTLVDGDDYLFLAHVSCDSPKFIVSYRENGILDSYTDYENNCRYSCYYNSDFTPSYYAMAYSVYCGTESDATADIICEYDKDNKLLRYSVAYSFGLTIFFDSHGEMIEDDEFDLLNPAANYQ